MITEMIQALSAGQQLKNSEGWKNAQLTSNAIAAVMAGTLAVLSLVGFHPAITHEQVLAIAGGVAAVLGVFNAYATVATSAKIGLPSSNGNSDATGNTQPPDIG